jgi:uncharacterized phage-associated protein
MTYDGREISNFILDFCQEKRRPITNLALQKILYFCHVWTLVDDGKPLVRHDFEAWEFGPVMQYVYHEFKQFEKSPITNRARRINAMTGAKEIVPYNFDERTRNRLVNIIDFYSRLTPGQLVDLSHSVGGPWDKVWHHDGQIRPGMKINNEEIRDYYSKANKPNAVQ